MNLKLLFFLSVICSSALLAQSITVTNIVNPEISPSAVIGDELQTTITGAAASSPVVLSWTQNGVPGRVTVGTTTISGNFYLTTTAVTGNDGAWTEQWSVGGVNLGPNFPLEIFNKPMILTVVSVGAASPDACGSSYIDDKGNQYSTRTYGPSASILYQIVNVSGTWETVPNSGLDIMLVPQEINGSDPIIDIVT
jgi:hypothetical protein